MEIIKTQNGDTVTLALTGRLDTATASKLEEVLLENIKTVSSVILDFSGIAYVSSAGLRVLLLGTKSAKANQKTFNLTNVSPDVVEVFEITGFSGILNIC
jgi:anti-anti-sigma factor